jgi:hypothetical protein
VQLIQVLVILSAVLQLSLTRLDVCACGVHKPKRQLPQGIHMKAGHIATEPAATLAVL